MRHVNSWTYLPTRIRDLSHTYWAASNTESLCGASRRSCGFFFPILGWCIGFERMEKTGRNVSYFINGGQERGFVCLRGFVKTADFSHELECSSSGFFRSYGRIEVEEGFDIPAHWL